MLHKRLTAYLCLLITSVIWGVSGPVIKVTLSEIPPEIFLTYRFGISSVIAVVLLSIFQQKMPKNSHGWTLLLMSGFMTTTIALGLLFLGFDRTSSLAGTLINAASPIFISLMGVIFFSEKINRHEAAGMAIAFVGTAITVAEPVFAISQTNAVSFQGNLLVVASMFTNITALSITKAALKNKISPLLLTQTSFMIGFASMATIALAYHSPAEIINTISHLTLRGHLGVWYMAVLSGTTAYFLNNIGLKLIEMGETSVFSYLTPIWAAPAAFLWLNESISGLFVIGGVIIAIGVTIAEFKSTRPLFSLDKKRGK